MPNLQTVDFTELCFELYQVVYFILIVLFLRQFTSIVYTDKQALLTAFCACKHRLMKNVPAEEIECNRWSYTDLDEKCLQKFEL